MSEQPQQTPGENPSQQPAQGTAQQPEIYDPPIEHDPIGQALITLPVELAVGAGEAVIEGGELGAHLLKEGISWAASELGIGAAEAATEHSDSSSDSSSSQGDSAGSDASATDVSGVPDDGGAPPGGVEADSSGG